MRPNKQNLRNGMAGTEESPLVLGEPNITVKVCVSLKRLLIVTLILRPSGCKVLSFIIQ